MTSKLLSNILPQLQEFLQDPSELPAQFADAYKLISGQLLPHVSTEPRSVDLSVYLWFVGAEGVNRGVGPFSDFIRSYTSTQSYLRSGIYASLEMQNLASNTIALDVISKIIESGGDVPTLSDIGNSDVTKAAEIVFSGDKAGWSGNILFPLLGESSFLISNLLSSPDDTYDIIAALHSFYDALALPETGQDLSLAFQMLTVMLLGNTSATLGGMADVVSETTAFLNTAYGLPAFPGYARVIAGVNVLDDTIDLTDVYEIVNAGGGDDTIHAALSAPTGDIIDGGAGYDTVSYGPSSALSDEHVDVHVGAPQLVQSEVSYTGYVSRSGVLNEDYLFDVETIVGTKNDDRFVVERVPLFLSAISVHGVAGVDTLDVSDVGTSPSRSTTLGGINLGSRHVEFSGFENIDLLGDIADRVALEDRDFGSGVALPVVDLGPNGSALVDGRLLTDGVDVSNLSESGGIADLRVSGAQSFQLSLTGETFHFRNAESFVGTYMDDIIYGGDLSGHLVGGGGRNIIYGGAGGDTIEGGADDDTLHGGGGDDRIYVANYSGLTDMAFGDAGNDVFVMTGGEEISVTGGAGDDIYYFSEYTDVDILISPGHGKDIVLGNPNLMAGTVTFVGVSRADATVTWSATPYGQSGHDYRGDLAIALKDGSASIVFKDITGSLEYGGNGPVYYDNFRERWVLNDFFGNSMNVIFSDGALDFDDGGVNVDMFVGTVSQYMGNYASIDLL